MKSISREFIADSFETELLNASLSNLKDAGNPLRYNNFAYSIRELSRHILSRLAPDDEIKECSWYKPQYNANKKEVITRNQRIRYSICGGLKMSLIETQLGLSDIDKVVDCLVATINDLSKYTHIEPAVFNLSDKDVKEKVSVVIETFNKFFKSIEDTRNGLLNELGSEINQRLIEEAIYNTNNEIEILSTHSSVDYFFVRSIEVKSLTSKQCSIRCIGNVSVRLQYGSDGDQRRDDGYVTNMKFPFSATMDADIRDNINDFEFNNIQLYVDTGSF